jgi:hypothetical protein
MALIKFLAVIGVIAAVIYGLVFLFTMPVAVSGPTTVGGWFLTFWLVDLIFKPKQHY